MMRLSESRAAGDAVASASGHAAATTLVDVVCLDMDGVLYDSLPQYVAAWTAAFHEAGAAISPVSVYRHEGRPSRETVHLLAREAGLAPLSAQRAERILDSKRRALAACGPPGLQRGARALVGALARAGLSIWVVTGSTRDGVRERLVADFAPHIAAERILLASDTARGKPDPEPYRLAARRAGVDPADMAVIENAPLGIESAVRAGAYCIAVNTGVLAREALLAAGARVVFTDCARLARNVDRLLAHR